MDLLSVCVSLETALVVFLVVMIRELARMCLFQHWFWGLWYCENSEAITYNSYLFLYFDLYEVGRESYV